MKKIDISIINEIYDDIINERNIYYDNIHNNDNRIEYIDNFINSIDIESEDYKLFSPFSSDDLYDGQIVELKNERDALLLNNNELYSLIDKLDSKIIRLDKLLSSLKSYI